MTRPIYIAALAGAVLSATLFAGNPAGAFAPVASMNAQPADETGPVTNVMWYGRPHFFHRFHGAFAFHRFHHGPFFFHRFHSCRWC